MPSAIAPLPTWLANVIYFQGLGALAVILLAYHGDAMGLARHAIQFEGGVLAFVGAFILQKKATQ